MLIKGEKYACDACIRGHRVSTCQHHDRPLTHINKKGRPVSQCPHCRGLRKARATHVKCDCGDKPHAKVECSHLNQAEPKIYPHGEPGHETTPDQHHVCCCSHGARCTCALKKEHLDTVPEAGLLEDVPLSNSESRRLPRLTSTQSETTLTVFTNGHHKPVHKHNDMAHKCGAPYKLPRSHTIHGHSEMAQRSMDSLPLTKRALLSQEATTPQQDTVTSAPHQPRLVKSEHGSPEMKSLSQLEPLNTTIPPLDVSYSPYDAGSPGMFPFIFERYQENYFAPQDVEPALNSAGLSAPSVDWSTFGLPYDNSGFTTENSQPPSYASFDYSNIGHPGLTASSSGDISEVEEVCQIPAARQNSQDRADISSVGDASEPDNQFRLSSASSFLGLQQASILASSNLESFDIDDFLKSAEAQTTALEQITTTVSTDSTKLYTSIPRDGGLTVSRPFAPPMLDDFVDEVGVTHVYSNPFWDNYDPMGGDVAISDTHPQMHHSMWRS